MKKSLCLGSIFALLFVVLVFLLKFADVSEQVGLSSLNRSFYKTFPFNENLYRISNCLGYLAILFGLVFAFYGFMQLVRTKKLLSVDRRILLLGILYVLTGLFYLVFTKVNINMRPVLVDGVNKPSFPSSHSILFTVVFLSCALNSNILFSNEKLSVVYSVLCIVLACLGVVLRALCGVHWFTDSLGGVFFGLSLLEFYKYFVSTNLLKWS